MPEVVTVSVPKDSGNGSLRLIFGVVVDATNNYDLAFAGVVGVLLLAVVETSLWIRNRSTEQRFAP